MNYIKVDNYKMKTTLEVDTVYDYGELLAKKAGIENYKQYLQNRADEELIGVNALIAECIKLGLKKPDMENV